MRRQIFISYRRVDSEGHAGRLYDRLGSHFGRRNVFMDVVAIEAGVDFAEEIKQAVRGCDVLLALIGPQWLTIKDKQGKLRLEDPRDFVRLEIAAALMQGIRVIPILLQGASMPPASALPEDLKPLSTRNALEVSAARFDTDVETLIHAIERAMDEAERQKRIVEPAGPSAGLVKGEEQIPPVEQTSSPAKPFTAGGSLTINKRGRSLELAFKIVIVAGIAILAALLLPRILSGPSSTAPTPAPPPTNTSPCTYPPQYGFECGASGWEQTDYFGSQAITAVTPSRITDRQGVHTTSLALTVDFTGPKNVRVNEHREAGEVQVDLTRFPPAGLPSTPVDLTDQLITAWVWASAGSNGDPAHPNGFQLFVKDSHNRNCYGEWVNIEPEEQWFQISWRETRAVLCDPGFDSAAPKVIGLKVALGENAVVSYAEPLTVYMNDVNWETP